MAMRMRITVILALWLPRACLSLEGPVGLAGVAGTSEVSAMNIS